MRNLKIESENRAYSFVNYSLIAGIDNEIIPMAPWKIQQLDCFDWP